MSFGRLPTALASAVCSHLTLGELARFRRVSCHAKTIGENAASTPEAIAYYSTNALRARPQFAYASPAGWAIVISDQPRSPLPPPHTGDVVADAIDMGGDVVCAASTTVGVLSSGSDAKRDSRPSVRSVANSVDFRAPPIPLPAHDLFPVGLLTTMRPWRATLEVDQERVDQLVVAATTATAATAPPPPPPEIAVADGVAASACETFPSLSRSASLSSLPSPSVRTRKAACEWAETMRDLTLAIRCGGENHGAEWLVRDLRGLECMTRLHILFLHTLATFHVGAVPAMKRLYAHLPHLPCLAQLHCDHLCTGAALRDVVRAFPNLRQLSNVRLLPGFSAGAFDPPTERDIAAADWAGLSRLVELTVAVDARHQDWSIPTGLDMLELVVGADDRRAASRGFPDPCRPLAPLVAVCEAQTRLRSLSIGFCDASNAPFWLFFEVPTLRDLELRGIWHAHGIDGVRADTIVAEEPIDAKSVVVLGQRSSPMGGDDRSSPMGGGQRSSPTGGSGEAGDADAGDADAGDADAGDADAGDPLVMEKKNHVERRESRLEVVRVSGNVTASAMRFPPTWFPRLDSLTVVAHRCNAADALRWRPGAIVSITVALPPPPPPRYPPPTLAPSSPLLPKSPATLPSTCVSLSPA